MKKLTLHTILKTPYKLLFFASLLAILIFVITGTSWGFVLISVITLASLLPSKSRVLGSATVRIAAALLSLMTFYQLISVSAWLMRVHVTVPLYALLGYLISVGFFMYAVRKQKSLSGFRISKVDLWVLLPAIMITGFYTARVILPAEDDTVSIIRSIGFGMDDASHMGMFGALLRNDANLLINQKVADEKMAIPSQHTYPMGWHVANVVMSASVIPHATEMRVTNVVATYFISKVLSLFGTILGITVLVLEIVQTLAFGKKKFWHRILVVFSIMFSAVIVVLPQFFDGFYSFLGVLIYTLAFTTAIVALNNPKTTPTEARFYDSIAILAIVGSAFCWVLTAPALMVTYSIVKLQTATKRQLRKSVVGLLLALTAFIFQVWVITRAQSSSLDALAATGGITSPDFMLFTILNGALILFAFATKPPIASQFRTLTLTLAPLYATLAAIFLYISLSSSSLTYYFYKFLLIILVVLFPAVLSTAAVYCLEKAPLVSRKFDLSFKSLAFMALVVVLIPGVIGFNYFSTIVHRSLHYGLTHGDGVVINKELNQPYGSTDNWSYILVDANKSRAVIGSNIIRAYHSNRSVCAINLYEDIYRYNIPGLSSQMNDCAGSVKTITLYGDAAALQQVKDRLSESSTSDAIQYQFVPITK